MKSYNVKIDNFSTILPEKAITNEEIFKKIGFYKLAKEIGKDAYLSLSEEEKINQSKKYELSPESFEAVTMIKQRYRFNGDESMIEKSIEVLKKCLNESGWNPLELDFIIFSSSSNIYSSKAYAIPSVGCKIQEAVGALNAWAYDMRAACSGWVYPIQQATAFIHSGMAKKGAVVVTEMFESAADYTNEKSSPLAGDCATCTLLSWSDDPGVFDVFCQANKDPKIPSNIITGTEYFGQKMEEPFKPVVDCFTRKHFPEPNDPQGFELKGKTVFIEGVKSMSKYAIENINSSKENFNKEPDWFVFHQANGAMLMKIIGMIEVDPRKNLYNIDRLGNTGGATIPSVMSENWENLKSGDIISAIAFGGGVTSGKLLFKKF